MNYFGRMEEPDIFIHPSSIIDMGAEIGKGTRIWHFCHVSSSSKLGENCMLGQNVFIGDNAVVGNRVKIQNNVSVFNGVEIGDDVFLGPAMVFTNVIYPRSFIERKHEFKRTKVRKGVSIGANATILCGIEIGEYAMIGAGAVVTKNVVPFALMIGNPARQVGWVSEVGVTLNFDEKGFAVCPQSGKKYKLANKEICPVE